MYALVIDDEPQISGLVARILESEGWTVAEASSAKSALNKLDEKPWSLVFCDVMLGDLDGYEVLRQFSEKRPEARFVIMTGHGSAAGALDATSFGAYDYLIKPFSIEEIVAISTNVGKQQRLRKKKRTAKDNDQHSEGYKSDLPLIGRSPKFVQCLKMVGRVAATTLPVLITGESGTGKEVVARAIHQRSRRAAGQFVAVNCGAIPAELIESELFGHAKGSFTGADRERVGLWELATGGTLLLDEVTETTPLFQVKLLRALQEGEIRRVGSNRTVKVDVRVIAATNGDIQAAVNENRFRQDLMYRLNAVTIELPPLRDRIEDIPLLVEYFAKQVLPADAVARISPAALSRLTSYGWPGNVRELENAVLHAISLSDGEIHPEHLPVRIRGLESAGVASHDGMPVPANTPHADSFLSLAEMEEQYVVRVLEHTGGNKQAAARLLNIDRKTLGRIIDRSQTR
jgi:DNA-binding NtrC family response regulator